LLFDAFEKSGSLARRVQHGGFADDDEEALEGKLQTLSVSESLQAEGRDDTCRLHNKDQGISVGINDSILTEDLSTINEGIPMG
jgi:hypothetical protein